MNSFIEEKEIKKLLLKKVGSNVKISKHCFFYNPDNISLGDNVRIDDFCILSGKITIGNNVHISAGTYLYAGDSEIIINDYSSVSSKSVIFATTDDYSGEYLANATVDSSKRNVIKGKVIIDKYCVIGTGSTILPGVSIKEGCAIGAMSLVNKSLEPWGIYVGIPCKRIKERSKGLLRFIEND